MESSEVDVRARIAPFPYVYVKTTIYRLQIVKNSLQSVVNAEFVWTGMAFGASGGSRWD